jgi:small subunit ribosomal protein S16
MKHLKGGVKKGAFDEAAAQKKFDAWKADKQNGLNKIAEAEAKAKKDAAANALKAEKAVNEAIAKKVADKKAAEAAAKAEAEAAKAAEEAAAETPEAPAAEEAAPAEA